MSAAAQAGSRHEIEEGMMNTRTAVVTGATGLLGSNLTRELVAGGWQVRAIVRDRAKAKRLIAHERVELVSGDMEDVQRFAVALEGADAVFHTAAYFREYYGPGDHWQTMKRVNVDATIELLQAAEARGVRKAVFTSSSGVIETRGKRLADETAPYSEFAKRNLYFQTKVLAEQAIAVFQEGASIDVTLALPGWMMGPGDAAPTSAGQMVLDLVERRLPAVIDGGASLADARDVARGMVAAAETGRRGERYIMTGPLVTMRQIADTLASVTGVPAPRRTLGPFAARTAARFADGWAAITRTASRMPRMGIETLLEKTSLDGGKAAAQLGVTYRSLRETLTDTVAWYRDHGYLGPIGGPDVKPVGEARVGQP